MLTRRQSTARLPLILSRGRLRRPNHVRLITAAIYLIVSRPQTSHNGSLAAAIGTVVGGRGHGVKVAESEARRPAVSGPTVRGVSDAGCERPDGSLDDASGPVTAGFKGSQIAGSDRHRYPEP